VSRISRSSSSVVEHQTINTSFNFTSLTPNTNYEVDVVSVSSTCSGAPKRISVTTSTREAGVPRSELALLHTLLSTKVSMQRRTDTIYTSYIDNLKLIIKKGEYGL